MSVETKTEHGRKIEARAEAWLVQRGFKLLARNFRIRGGEIDLVLEEGRGDDAELVFVEVRSRLSGSWLGGLESVDWRKRQRLARAGSWFLARYRGPAQSVRFDVLSWDGQDWEHVRNAWSV